MTSLAARVINDDAGFAALRPVWTELLLRSKDAHAFLSWEWADAWWRHFRGYDRLEIVAFERGGQLEALVPMVCVRSASRGAPDVLVSLGHEHADYGGLLLGPEPWETLPEVLQFFDTVADASNTVVDFVRLATDGPFFEALRTSYREHPSLVLERHETVPCGLLEFDTVEDPVAHVARLAKRHDAPCEYRRLGRNYATTFEFDVDWPTDDAVRILFDLHDRRWNDKHDEMLGLFSGARTQQFAVDAIRSLSDAGFARISFVTADDKPVVGSVGYVCRDVFSWHKFAFDPEFNTYSPGHIILSLMLDETARLGLREFNFGRGDEAYKNRWVTGWRKVTSVTLRRRGMRGRIQSRGRTKSLAERERMLTSSGASAAPSGRPAH